jgi:hypothetical protein
MKQFSCPNVIHHLNVVKKKNQQMGIKLEGIQGQVDIRVGLGELVG